jgi:hypothetical protein
MQSKCKVGHSWLLTEQPGNAKAVLQHTSGSCRIPDHMATSSSTKRCTSNLSPLPGSGHSTSLCAASSPRTSAPLSCCPKAPPACIKPCCHRQTTASPPLHTPPSCPLHPLTTPPPLPPSTPQTPTHVYEARCVICCGTGTTRGRANGRRGHLGTCIQCLGLGYVRRTTARFQPEVAAEDPAHIIAARPSPTARDVANAARLLERRAADTKGKK